MRGGLYLSAYDSTTNCKCRDGLLDDLVCREISQVEASISSSSVECMAVIQLYLRHNQFTSPNNFFISDGITLFLEKREDILVDMEDFLNKSPENFRVVLRHEQITCAQAYVPVHARVN
jgi:hypothetical protein